jgi:2-oxoglutarate ferredoxin oxidoreductase subunit gamma
MNLPSILKFEPTLKPGGVLLLNKSLIHQDAQRSDIKVYEIPANEMANELGNPRVANMIMLGAFVRTTGIISSETMVKVIHDTFDVKKAELAELNLKAFHLWQV